jgi:hypothetical protein
MILSKLSARLRAVSYLMVAKYLAFRKKELLKDALRERQEDTCLNSSFDAKDCNILMPEFNYKISIIMYNKL